MNVSAIYQIIEQNNEQRIFVQIYENPTKYAIEFASS